MRPRRRDVLPGPSREPEGPPLPEDLDPRLLDSEVRQQLRSLARPVAEQVALRLVAAGETIDADPGVALAHALVARRLSPRVAAVREAVGLAAYQAGQWQTAMAELRAYHRMTGRQTHLAVLADCERALGRPERAIDLFRATDRGQLAPDEAAELLIVAAGARADLGQLDAAVSMLQVRELASDQPWAARLRYAYADALLAVGRKEESREWFARAAEIDEEALTDAAERLLDLDGVLLDDESGEVDEEYEEFDASSLADDGETSVPDQRLRDEDDEVTDVDLEPDTGLERDDTFDGSDEDLVDLEEEDDEATDWPMGVPTGFEDEDDARDQAPGREEAGGGSPRQR